jgi:hypothetical protein
MFSIYELPRSTKIHLGTRLMCQLAVVGGFCQPNAPSFPHANPSRMRRGPMRDAQSVILLVLPPRIAMARVRGSVMSQ